MNYFTYSKGEINAMIDEYIEKGMQRAKMAGVYNDLAKLKPVIEEIYEKNIFYLSYFATDGPYFGWTDKELFSMLQITDRITHDGPYLGWTGKELFSMLQITDRITQKFKEIYALTLCGLGEKLE